MRGYSESSIRSFSPSMSLKTRSVVLVHPFFAVAMKTLVSSKNLVVLACNLVALFLNALFQLIQIHITGFFDHALGMIISNN